MGWGATMVGMATTDLDLLRDRLHWFAGLARDDKVLSAVILTLDLDGPTGPVEQVISLPEVFASLARIADRADMGR